MNCDNGFLHLFENIKHIKQCELKIMHKYPVAFGSKLLENKL